MIRTGVVRGGPGYEYEVSLKTGASVLKNLPREKYLPRDILIDKQGVWHIDGLPFNQNKLPEMIDVAVIALHGEFGEDGQIQSFFDQLKIPYTGSGHLASALGMNKQMSKEIVAKLGLKTPSSLLVKKGEIPAEIAQEIFQKISPPWIVKPSDRGSSVGLFLANNVSELAEAIERCFEFTDSVLVEEFIKGREATCGVVEDLRGLDLYPLFPIEIIPPQNKKIWGYNDKYSGETKEICPGNFSEEQKREIQEMAIKIHQALGLKHYSRSDFIVSSKGIYFLEVNTLPGLTDTSLLPRALQAAGIKYQDFLEHLIKMSIG